MASQVSLAFFGAAGTVTGSRYLLDVEEQRVLIDCGLFQGYKHLRERNWKPFPVDPATIEAVFLTHAHLDHSGYLPRLVKDGFDGPVYCTRATRDLCRILLLDSAKLQEEEAEFRNRHNYSKHKPALPLYTQHDARKALEHFEVVDFSMPESPHPGITMGQIEVGFYPNGHILGSSYLDVKAAGKHILFSGDLGRGNDLVMRAPELPLYCDYLVVESTYGNRLHDNRDVWEAVAEIVNDTLSGGGSLLIPSFAVGRAQAMLYLITELRRRGKIPYVPIFLDSPMAISVTELMQRHHRYHRLNKASCQQLSRDVTFTRDVQDSIAINNVNVPAIILSASGMATGGRVLHHLQRMVGDHRNTVMFAGYQAPGTRGARLVEGEKRIKIFNRYFDVKARIESLDFLSAHADRLELLRWVQQLPAAPKHCFVTHGEESASDQFRISLSEELGWRASVPDMGDRVEL
ncbi:MBL fold metallo-hydrolase RNA specificity domain-containing protein [Porticoccus litoralis]|uniref:MBL fold metallo-hydrolase n=1 Tax=Porticoccus litoralis TaxID=434086 RepID=A0AAW8B4V5_9GAMM|nr:MBL fold metallo-hydrolase [Porticoccus litoralis]MDP1521475.1 MBL fold metallo-hydrolase [Porticoccus litoralis]